MFSSSGREGEGEKITNGNESISDSFSMTLSLSEPCSFNPRLSSPLVFSSSGREGEEGRVGIQSAGLVCFAHTESRGGR